MPVEDYLQHKEWDYQGEGKETSHCEGCGLNIDEWPMHSHTWLEGTDTVYCREVGGQFQVKDLEKIVDLP